MSHTLWLVKSFTTPEDEYETAKLLTNAEMTTLTFARFGFHDSQGQRRSWSTQHCKQSINNWVTEYKITRQATWKCYSGIYSRHPHWYLHNKFWQIQANTNLKPGVMLHIRRPERAPPIQLVVASKFCKNHWIDWFTLINYIYIYPSAQAKLPELINLRTAACRWWSCPATSEPCELGVLQPRSHVIAPSTLHHCGNPPGKLCHSWRGIC